MKKNELIRLSGVAKSFDDDVILKSLNLSVNDGKALWKDGCVSRLFQALFLRRDHGAHGTVGLRKDDDPQNYRRL